MLCYAVLCYAKVALIGDAAHAIVPFFGQGMNSGFEDARDLLDILSKHAPAGSASKDYAAAFAAYEAARKPNANAIADMALENYTEMQSSTADPRFRVCKAVENALENSALGVRFRSRYAMVCYGGLGGVTYAAAQALGRVQWEIVCELAEGVESADEAAEKLDVARAEQLLDEKLAPMQVRPPFLPSRLPSPALAFDGADRSPSRTRLCSASSASTSAPSATTRERAASARVESCALASPGRRIAFGIPSTPCFVLA